MFLGKLFGVRIEFEIPYWKAEEKKALVLLINTLIGASLIIILEILEFFCCLFSILSLLLFGRFLGLVSEHYESCILGVASQDSDFDLGRE